MNNPRDVVPMSIMPTYPWLLTKKTNYYSLRKKLSVMKYLGVPYTEDELARADLIAEREAKTIADLLREQGVVDDQLEQKEIVSLIAYLQALGKKGKEPVQAAEGQ